ncbi:MAG: PD-(D/E)XK nuclease family protein [Chromatiales bacterium]|nr:PD-(D/E)XK nuclease family protein [Chromatiales bacterium]
MTDPATDEEVLAGGGTVITATHRLARQIRQDHDRARAAAGALAWPTADALPIDAWLRRTWESTALRDSALGRHRLLSDDESRLVWRRVLASKGEERLDSGVILPLVAAGWRLCQAWGITPATLATAADSEDSRIFARWVQAYVRELERRAWIDSAGLLRALGQAGVVTDSGARVAGEAPVGFAGFDPWTPALASLADRLRAAGTAVSLIAPPRRTGTLGIVAARDGSEELARAFAWAASHSDPGTGSPPAIIVPDLERDAGRIRRIGLDTLAPGWQLREPPVRPLALAIGRQLADYPVVFCALNLLQLLAFDVSFEQASLLLRSCYLAGAEVERPGRAGAELALRRLPLERVGLPRLLQLLGNHAPLLAKRWQQAESLASGLRARRLPPGQWASHFAAWLTAAGWPGDRGLASEEFQVAEAWQRLLEAFAGTDEVAGPLSLGAALGFLAQQARDRPFEPESASDAIQVLTPQEAEGQAFRALWVCGMTADRWPPPARPHALIPLALQQAAGMPEATPAVQEARTRRRFERLLASADHVVLSWPAEQDEAETLPSPLLTGLGGEGIPGGEIPLHRDRQQVAASVRVEQVATDQPPPLAAGQGVTGGARVLAMQAVCPARAFVEFRLRGAPLEPAARPLDAAMRGQVVHKLLERLYRLEQCRRGLGHLASNALRQLFEPLVAEVLAGLLPESDPFLDRLRSLETERLWSLLLTLRDLEADRPGFSAETELARAVTIGPLSLRVRLDRLDRLDAGGELVIDYKTGKFAYGGWKRPRVPESQLPLYAVSGGCDGVAVIEFRQPAARLRGVADVAIAVPGIKTPPAFFRTEGLDWQGALARWRSQLEALAGEFCGGDYRVNPADRKWAVDQFAGLTRIHEFLPSTDGDESPGEGEE